jgi:type I restriction enzyme R subunit
MSGSRRIPIQVFDPKEDFTIFERRLPHWSQAGTVAFITWRTWDSIPVPVLEQWLEQRDAWLLRHGIHPGKGDWRALLRERDLKLQREFAAEFSNRWNDLLDDCRGACVLRRTELAKVVADSLRHFDGARYELTDFVIMPNHIHLLAAFADEETMLGQCESWKHFTATKLNRSLGRNGRFWQQDGFDYLVRSPEQFLHFRRYIAENPCRADLKDGEFVHWSKAI